MKIRHNLSSDRIIYINIFGLLVNGSFVIAIFCMCEQTTPEQWVGRPSFLAYTCRDNSIKLRTKDNCKKKISITNSQTKEKVKIYLIK